MLYEGLVWKISTGGASPLRGAGSWRSFSYDMIYDMIYYMVYDMIFNILYDMIYDKIFDTIYEMI